MYVCVFVCVCDYRLGLTTLFLNAGFPLGYKEKERVYDRERERERERERGSALVLLFP